jgi:hypothetical protein
MDWIKDSREGTTTPLLETSEIQMNKGSDNSQIHTSNLKITSPRTSSRQMKVPVTKKNDFFMVKHTQKADDKPIINHSDRLTNTINSNHYNKDQDCVSINS